MGESERETIFKCFPLTSAASSRAARRLSESAAARGIFSRKSPLPLETNQSNLYTKIRDSAIIRIFTQNQKDLK